MFFTCTFPSVMCSGDDTFSNIHEIHELNQSFIGIWLYTDDTSTNGLAILFQVYWAILGNISYTALNLSQTCN